ncbi:MAG: phosphate/phosphite/phosphonate ABC transporter substrate-binding protein [Oceanospirillales bacterium]|nr:phosphate/phosphite/phosphonate ABC transporter substrate-binding protein [Oceanospirillales bacterium]
MIRTLLLGVILLVWGPLSIAAGSDDESCNVSTLRFSMIPKNDVERQVEGYKSLTELLEQRLQVPVQIIRPTSYNSVVEGVVTGAVDLAVLGPAAYVRAHGMDSRVTAFASLSYAADFFTPRGEYYSSILVANADSPFTDIKRLRGARVAFTDPGSTSGELIPSTQFVKEIGGDLNRFFASRIYAGSHDKAMEALLDRRVDAAFVSSSRADRFLDQGRIDKSSFRVLWRSEPIHFDPFVFGTSLCPSLRKRIAEFMLSGDDQLEPYLGFEGASAIIPVTDDAYAPIAELSQ